MKSTVLAELVEEKRIQKREKDVKLLQKEVEAINLSADKAVRDSEKTFTDVKQQIRSRQESEVAHTFEPRPVLMKSTVLAELVEEQRIQKREKDVKLLQQDLEAINLSADKAVRDSEKIFTDVKQQIRSRQESEVAHTFEPRPVLMKNTVLAELVEEKELGVSRQNIQKRIQKREKDVKLLQKEVEAINLSADKAVRDSEKIFTDVKQQIRSRQESEVAHLGLHICRKKCEYYEGRIIFSYFYTFKSLRLDVDDAAGLDVSEGGAVDVGQQSPLTGLVGNEGELDMNTVVWLQVCILQETQSKFLTDREKDGGDDQHDVILSQIRPPFGYLHPKLNSNISVQKNISSRRFTSPGQQYLVLHTCLDVHGRYTVVPDGLDADVDGERSDGAALTLQHQLQPHILTQRRNKNLLEEQITSQVSK
ncbi:hypothetical protein F7725_015242 [Dissostichus mawsoni]|uniref:Uncharacterized protein n=1 Tax=Dissostichus mawsoni TaxID=36200 RepID=A0A7J5YH11_DISMA|nr:hypothetical protein F7725_015242 [Dissostichus mawsoni]